MQERVYEQEKTIKEIIRSILRSWKIIIAMTIIFAILGGIYAFLLASPVYESKIYGTIFIPDTIETKYGPYKFPSINKMDYLNFVKSETVINRTIEDLNLDKEINSISNNIRISVEAQSNAFSFAFTGNDPVQTSDILQSLSDNFYKEINLLYKNRVINTLVASLQVRFENNTQMTNQFEYNILQMEEYLNTIEPKITLQKLVLSDPTYAVIIANERNVRIEDLTDEMMLEEVINPDYTNIQSGILLLKQQRNAFEYDSKRDSDFIEELQDSQNNNSLAQLEVLRTQIHTDENASFSENPIAPRKLMLLITFTMVGAMLGIFVAIAKGYWKGEF